MDTQPRKATEMLREAVERIEPLAKSKQAPDWMNNHKAWKQIKQALRDQEAEIARLDRELVVTRQTCLNVGDEFAKQRYRAEKAETLLAEVLGSIGDDTSDQRDIATRITAHLGTDHD